MTAPSLQSILFICRHNSVRSQVAALLAKKISNNDLVIDSAGPEPKDVPEFVQDLAEQMGLDSKLESKSLTQVADRPFDLIITLCDKSHQALPSLQTDQENVRWDFHHSDTSEDFKHLEMELAERIRLLLLTKGVI